MRRSCRGQAGYSLVDLLVGTGVALLALLALGTLTQAGLKAYRDDNARHEAVQSLRAGLERVGRDVRTARSAAVRDGGTTLILTDRLGTEIKYYLAGTDLIRQRGDQPRVLASGLQSATFEYDFRTGLVFADVVSLVPSGQPYRAYSKTLRRGPGGSL